MNHRTRRAAAAFLLALALALPVAALPAPARAQSWPGFFAALWTRVAPVLGISERSRSTADPDGATVSAPLPPAENDSRGSADPNG
jgi:hypothetical protein